MIYVKASTKLHDLTPVNNIRYVSKIYTITAKQFDISVTDLVSDPTGNMFIYAQNANMNAGSAQVTSVSLIEQPVKKFRLFFDMVPNRIQLNFLFVLFY